MSILDVIQNAMPALQSFADYYDTRLNERQMAQNFAVAPEFAAQFYGAQNQQEAIRQSKLQAQQENALRMLDLQMQAQAEATKLPDVKKLADAALYNFYQGQPLDAQGLAAIKAADVTEGQKTSYQVNERGEVRAVTNPNPYAQFLAQYGVTSNAPMAAGGIKTLAQAGAQPAYAPGIAGGAYDPAAANKAAVLAALEADPTQNPPLRDDFLTEKGENMGVPDAMQALGATDYTPGEVVDAAPVAPILTEEGLTRGIANPSPNTLQKVEEKMVDLAAERSNPLTDIGKMQRDESLGLVPAGSTEALIQEKTRQTRKMELEAKEAEEAAKKAEEYAKTSEKIVKKELKQSYELLAGGKTGGLIGTASLKLPGKVTPTDQLQAKYDVLKSNLSLEKLMQLKSMSPTGASGFGALTAPELKILTDNVALLDVELPKEIQKSALDNIALALGVDPTQLMQETEATPSGGIKFLGFE